MMTPGNDFNYPTSSGNAGAGGKIQGYLPHGLVGILLLLILALIVWHLVGGKRKRR